MIDKKLHRTDDSIALIMAVDAVKKDKAIHELYKKMADAIRISPIVNYIVSEDGNFEARYSEEVHEFLDKVQEQIEHRKQQILFAYNCESASVGYIKKD